MKTAIKKSVVVIGNFDGVHLGHAHIMAQGKSLAARHDYDFTVLTFTPHPRSVFQPNVAPFRITPDNVKEDLVQDIAAPDHYVTLKFDHDFQHLTAADFVQSILIDQLNAAIVIVGPDFHFGHERQGTIATLQACDKFQTIPSEFLNIGDDRVSSTRIRNHIKGAEIHQANTLLGWDWFIESEVVHGDKRGREIGYPTANMHFGETIVPSHGVYAVKVQVEGSQEWLNGAANIGIRPMFETAMPMLETYIFDFDADLYGQNLKIKPVQKIRGEMKYDDLDTLVKQIDKDCALIKSILIEVK